MRKKSKAERLLDDHIERLYGVHAQGKSISVLDIGQVFDAGHAAAATGGSVEEAVKAAIQRLCV